MNFIDGRNHGEKYEDTIEIDDNQTNNNDDQIIIIDFLGIRGDK